MKKYLGSLFAGGIINIHLFHLSEFVFLPLKMLAFPVTMVHNVRHCALEGNNSILFPVQVRIMLL